MWAGTGQTTTMLMNSVGEDFSGRTAAYPVSRARTQHAPGPASWSPRVHGTSADVVFICVLYFKYRCCTHLAVFFLVGLCAVGNRSWLHVL